ncbi:MAG TPA: helix-turn-helix transcriptional regulator [Longimicrobium sp.]|jgi:ribosome-binding protein aMBF1 (putative translation factor)|nr:helix-turn-helix transcriptional regulator [Longimicrobium sp.]
MSLRMNAVAARDLAAEVRSENPAVAVAEQELATVLARNVLRLRNQRGMTQRDLARALGVSQPRIAEIEAARTTARIDTVGKLAAVFGIEAWRLLKPRPAAAQELVGVV